MTNPADNASLLSWANGQYWCMEKCALEAMTAQLVTLAHGQPGPPLAVRPQGPRSIAPGAAEAGIAVIPVVGVLSYRPGPFSSFFGGTTMVELIAEVNAAAAASPVKAILLLFDSPGGVASGQLEAAAAIRAARDKKPVLAMIDPLAASAAFWLAAQASRVIITPSGHTGSLGVFALHLSFAEALKQAGIKPTLISSTPEKTEFSPVLKLSDAARAAAQREVDLIFNDFLKDVALGRGLSVSTVRRDFGRGRVVNAKDSIRDGLADQVEVLEAALVGVRRTFLPLATTPIERTPRAGGAALGASSTPPRRLSQLRQVLEPKPSPQRRRLRELDLSWWD